MKKNIEELFDLEGKVVIVTGGAMGIGKAIAIRLAEAGASIVIADLVAEKESESTLHEIRHKGGEVTYLQVDLSNSKNLQKVIDSTLKIYGDIHILVNNAGIYRYVSVLELTEELWDKTLNLNLKSVAFLSQLAANAMIAKKHGGKIINISSIDSLKPSGNLAQYDSSKGGVRMLTKAFAKEVGKFGITVNDIAPGGVNTPGVHKVSGNNASKEEQEASEKQIDQFMKSLPLARMGEPEDIANAALFLASDASNYMTGSTVVVDGGLLLM